MAFSPASRLGLAALITLAATSPALAQAPEAPTTERAAARAPTAAAFPAAWFGRWAGEVVGGTDARPQRFSMELVVAPTDAPDRFTWTIIYDGSAGRQERKYTLVVKDAAKGEYAIDENNGIVLDARLLAGGLYTQFLVQGSRISTRYRLENAAAPDAPPHIAFELLTFIEDQPGISGGKDNIPEVRSWAPASIQQAKLKRVAEGAAAYWPR